MAVRKTSTKIEEVAPVAPVAPSPEDFQAAVEAAVNATLKAREPVVTVVRCKSCWKPVIIGAPNSTGVSSTGIGFDCCYRHGQTIDHSFVLARRIGIGGHLGGTFIPGSASEVATVLGITLDDIVDEHAISDEALALGWDKANAQPHVGFAWPKRPPTKSEQAVIDQERQEAEDRRKLRGLLAQRNALYKTLNETNEKLEEIAPQIAALEATVTAAEDARRQEGVEGNK